VAAAFNPLLAALKMAPATITKNQLLRPFPQYQQILVETVATETRVDYNYAGDSWACPLPSVSHYRRA
jgi:hypothetical protein